VEALATACASFVIDRPGRPAVATLRRVLTVHVLPPEGRRDDLDAGEQAAVTWLLTASRSVADLAERGVVRELLDGLTKNLDGATAAATVIGRKRAVVHNLLGYGVERGMLAANPVRQVAWRRPKRVE
jgi:hypothetical protein